ncbi:MAG: hypothetical protein JST55_10525 [Bacteroidetes bacterium]|nr:hypothetical protein [Bacteroidota bacterium]
MKILALSRDISLLNIVDYILYKDYKIIKSTSFENLDADISSFDLIVIDLPYWEESPNIKKVLNGINLPIIILTEDKSAAVLSNLKNEYNLRTVLKEPLSKKELKETVKELSKKKKNKKDKDRSFETSEVYISSPIESLVNNNEVVFFRITDLQEKRIEYISDNYKKVFNINHSLGNLKEFAEDHEIPFISNSSPEYSTVYKIKNESQFIVLKESGKGIFDANKYLVNVEGTIINYTDEYIKQSLVKFVGSVFNIENFSLDTSEFIRKIVHEFSLNIPKDLIQLSITFSGKDYFTNDFIPTDFLISSDIISSDKKQGEVLLFSLNNNYDDTLKEFSKILADVILIHSESEQLNSKYSTETSELKQELNLITNRLTQAEAAFHDKAKSFDNLNELFNSAMKDFKVISSKFSRTAIIFETNAEGKFLSANENYYRAVAKDKSSLAGKFFDEIFDNSNWQNFQFEFFNNANQEVTLKQKNKEGRASYFSFHISREETDNGYKFVFYGKDKTEAKSLEIELGKQISEYNSKVTELIDAKKANELLWEEINTLKEELKEKDETIKKQEKKLLKVQEQIETKPEIPVTPSFSKDEYKLDSKEAEEIFKEDVEQKIEEAKEEITATQDENEAIFKNLRGIDFKIGLANAYDNIDTYNEILVNFENDYADFVKDVKGMYLVNDNEYIKSRLLTLSEESKYIGAEDLEKSAQLFHDKLADNKINNFDFELSVLGVHLNFTLESIRKYKDEYSLLEPKPKEDVITHEDVESKAEVFDVIQEKEFTISLAPEKTEEFKERSEEESKTEFNEELITESFETQTDIDVEQIAEENKLVDEIHQEVLVQELNNNEPEIKDDGNIQESTEEKANDNKEETVASPFVIHVNDLQKSIENSEDTSILKEKLFKLKFENSDFNKIEKLEELESCIESGNHSSAISILNELKS